MLFGFLQEIFSLSLKYLNFDPANNYINQILILINSSKLENVHSEINSNLNVF